MFNLSRPPLVADEVSLTAGTTLGMLSFGSDLLDMTVSSSSLGLILIAFSFCLTKIINLKLFFQN